ncbi:hypothetical protein LQZ19_09620 [Treponema primitia]
MNKRLDKLITNGNFEVGPNLLKQGIMPQRLAEKKVPGMQGPLTCR